VVDFSGYTALMQIKDEDNNIIVELSTENQRIVASSTGIKLTIDYNITKELDSTLICFYDLFIEKNSDRQKYIYGNVNIEESITKEATEGVSI